jgi:hypothetical protein
MRLVDLRVGQEGDEVLRGRRHLAWILLQFGHEIVVQRKARSIRLRELF